METTEKNEKATVSYPTAADAQGWFFENETEQENGISTKEYENGKLVKRLYINRGKTEVILRELAAKDSKQTAAMAGFVDGKKGDAQDLKYATVHLAATFNGEKMPMEEISNLRMKDFSLIMQANEALNF